MCDARAHPAAQSSSFVSWQHSEGVPPRLLDCRRSVRNGSRRAHRDECVRTSRDRAPSSELRALRVGGLRSASLWLHRQTHGDRNGTGSPLDRISTEKPSVPLSVMICSVCRRFGGLQFASLSSSGTARSAVGGGKSALSSCSSLPHRPRRQAYERQDHQPSGSAAAPSRSDRPDLCGRVRSHVGGGFH